MSDIVVRLIRPSALIEVINEAFVAQLHVALRAHPWAPSSCTEDVLSTVQLFTSQYLNIQIQPHFAPSLAIGPNFNRRLLGGIYHTLGVILDHTLEAQVEQPHKNIYFQRCLGVQASLGSPGECLLRPTEGTVALVMLSLKHFSTVLLYVCAKKADGSESEALRKPGQPSHLPSRR